MSDRITRKDVEGAFELLCATLGKRIATAYNDVGAWQLDHNSIYGGFVIEEVVNVHGGVSRPMGDQRCNAREFRQMCLFTVRAIQSAKVTV